MHADSVSLIGNICAGGTLRKYAFQRNCLLIFVVDAELHVMRCRLQTQQ